MRKFIVIAIICIIIIAIGAAVYAFLQDDASGKEKPIRDVFPISLFYPASSVAPDGQGIIPPPQNGKSSDWYDASSGPLDPETISPIPLSNEEIYGFWIQHGTSSAISTWAYFFTKDGTLKKNDGAGEQTVLSNSYGMPLRIRQNTSGASAAILFDSGAVYLYSVERKAWDLLGEGITDFSFSPDGTRIVALKERNGRTSVVQYEPFVFPKRTTVLVELDAVDLRMQWPQAQRVIFTPTPSYFTEGFAWVLNLQNRTVSRLSSGNGMSSIVSLFSNRIMFIKSESKSKSVASLHELSGNLVQEYPHLILQAKCGASLSIPVVFCGVPQLMKSGSFILPDDYLKRKLFTHDELIGISVETGETFSFPFTADASVDMSAISHANGSVYFINRLDNRLYTMPVGM